jgi:hypothetical protein
MYTEVVVRMTVIRPPVTKIVKMTSFFSVEIITLEVVLLEDVSLRREVLKVGHCVGIGNHCETNKAADV